MTVKKTPAKKAAPAPSRQKAAPAPSRQKAAEPPSSVPSPVSRGLGIKDKFKQPSQGSGS